MERNTHDNLRRFDFAWLDMCDTIIDWEIVLCSLTFERYKNGLKAFEEVDFFEPKGTMS